MGIKITPDGHILSGPLLVQQGVPGAQAVFGASGKDCDPGGVRGKNVGANWSQKAPKTQLIC
jgi:hypothetical protein